MVRAEPDWVERANASGEIPLMWVRSNPSFRFANLGDALSAVVVAGLSGLRIQPANFRSSAERMSAIGTIAHNFVGGRVHLWGTGIDERIDPGSATWSGYKLPPDTDIVAHAVRGPFTRRVLRKQGIDMPPFYGDPACFIRRIYNPETPKTHDIGVVLHISELSEPTPDAGPKSEFLRYLAPEGGPTIRIINTYHAPDFSGVTAKMDELLSCRRIVSTSFHGLMLADLYGIPSAFFSLRDGGGALLHPKKDWARLDHRIADFYGGMKGAVVTTFQQPRLKPTRWDDVIRHIDATWQPADIKPDALLGTFPFKVQETVDMGLLADLAL